jgi:predicted transcriptional regulator
MSDKEVVLQKLRQMPEDTSLEAIIEELQILTAIRKGVRAADAGKTKTHEQVKQLLKQWR